MAVNNLTYGNILENFFIMVTFDIAVIIDIPTTPTAAAIEYNRKIMTPSIMLPVLRALIIMAKKTGSVQLITANP